MTANFTQKLSRIARKYTRGSAIAWEDAAQSAQFKILQAVQSGKFRRGGLPEFDRWATTVARFEVIDLVRREKIRQSASLDAVIPGTDLVLAETIADDFNALETLERSDLLLSAIAAIHRLDQQSPERKYLQLWQGRVEEKKQTQLATELNLSQGEVSKRWQELVGKIAEMIGVLRPEMLEQEHQAVRQTVRRRSKAQW